MTAPTAPLTAWRGARDATAPLVVLLHGRGADEQDIPGLADLLPTGPGGVALADPGRLAGLATLYATLPFDAGLPTNAGRLSGLPVLVAQGDGDTVIPPELQRRTWDHLHGDAGATLTARRSPGGPGLTQDDVTALGAWLDGVVR